MPTLRHRPPPLQQQMTSAIHWRWSCARSPGASGSGGCIARRCTREHTRPEVDASPEGLEAARIAGSCCRPATTDGPKAWAATTGHAGRAKLRILGAFKTRVHERDRSRSPEYSRGHAATTSQSSQSEEPPPATAPPRLYMAGDSVGRAMFYLRSSLRYAVYWRSLRPTYYSMSCRGRIAVRLAAAAVGAPREGDCGRWPALRRVLPMLLEAVSTEACW